MVLILTELLQVDPFTTAWSATVGGGVVDPPASHTQGMKFWTWFSGFPVIMFCHVGPDSTAPGSVDLGSPPS